jgi:L(+)-tartrate dehydratase alpha subunit
MADNQEAADKLDRPSCQDTGVIQYFIRRARSSRCWANWEDILPKPRVEATREGPLRHNAVETFVEKNTGTNTGTKIPWLDWEIVPDDDGVTIDVYMAGGGCTLPGSATVLMPGQGYEGCPSSCLTSSPRAASMPARRCWSASACPPRSKPPRACPRRPLMRPVGSQQRQPNAAKMENCSRTA